MLIVAYLFWLRAATKITVSLKFNSYLSQIMKLQRLFFQCIDLNYTLKFPVNCLNLLVFRIFVLARRLLLDEWEL